MKIVVTDGYTLNPGDLSWDRIKLFGDLTIYDRTPPELIVERCRDADIVLTNKVPFSGETLNKIPQLKFISVLATGYNVIDIAAAQAAGIVVCNVPGYSTASVAQHTLALLLELTNHVGRNGRSTAEGKWQQSEDFCYTEAPITEMDGKTFGIVGFGTIGRQTARVAKALGMEVVYYNPSKKDTDLGEPRDLDRLFAESDVVSLHCPAKEDNIGFVNYELLKKMKSSALLINTARGQLINEEDLARALNQGVIKGAGLDVLSKEPPSPDNPLLTAKNCIITPHTAWISKEARQRVMEITASNIEAFLKEQPQNRVS